jgi:hypothetical protein
MRSATVFLLIMTSGSAQADQTVQLLDGTKIVAEMLHYYDDVLTVRLPNGSKLRLPRTKIRSVSFKLPPPRAEFGTPQKAFARLRNAALTGNLATYVDCHSTYYQMFLNHQVELAGQGKFVKRLKKEWGGAQLSVVGTTIKGATAVMKVKRQEGDESREGELRFLKENGEWKMILPL